MSTTSATAPFGTKPSSDVIALYLRTVYAYLGTGHGIPDLDGEKAAAAAAFIREHFPAAWAKAEGMNVQELVKALKDIVFEQERRRLYLATVMGLALME